MQNKKTIMAVATIMILIFHLWINVTNSIIENFLRYICVIGVDLFFFVSAYSIGKKKNIEYKEFLLNRINSVYFKFFLLSIVCAFYVDWGIFKFIKTVLGIELFTNGGGSFLWFIPSIMIVYILLPLYKKLDNKYPRITLSISFTIYMLTSIIISLYTNYTALFIFSNRILITLIGFYFAKYRILEKMNMSKRTYFVITFILLFIGTFISYNTYIKGFKLSWLNDVFYLLHIPLEIGLILLLDKIKENKVIKMIGSATLESYGLQMIIGFKLANVIYKKITYAILSNIVSIVVILILSLILKYIFDLIQKMKESILNSIKLLMKEG